MTCSCETLEPPTRLHSVTTHMATIDITFFCVFPCLNMTLELNYILLFHVFSITSVQTLERLHIPLENRHFHLLLIFCPTLLFA
jgi:hypothetical protein